MRTSVLFFMIYSCSLFSDAPLNSKIPLLIWQTDKSSDLSFAASHTRQTWLILNPVFPSNLSDDADIECYIEQTWAPDFLELFQALPIRSMKADLWRYSILTTEGGAYSDTDSFCLVP